MINPALFTNVFFITGTSGSGKTTLMHYLKSKLPNTYEIYDFDEVGVPSDADAAWRQQTTNYWVKQAKKNSIHNKSTVVCGVSVPTEVLNAAHQYNVPIYFGFIKVSDDVIEERLSARKWTPELIQNNINWAHHLEAEVQQTKNHLIVTSSLYHSPEEIGNEFITWFETIAR